MGGEGGFEEKKKKGRRRWAKTDKKIGRQMKDQVDLLRRWDKEERRGEWRKNPLRKRSRREITARGRNEYSKVR